uniref:Uncharacterized protein n=1 Tax=Rhizophora mucronata TaxID=61149 RepID=A0A2P2PBL9_RHIMU
MTILIGRDEFRCQGINCKGEKKRSVICNMQISFDVRIKIILV